jgi:hypothetical protein
MTLKSATLLLKQNIPLSFIVLVCEHILHIGSVIRFVNTKFETNDLPLPGDLHEVKDAKYNCSS